MVSARSLDGSTRMARASAIVLGSLFLVLALAGGVQASHDATVVSLPGQLPTSGDRFGSALGVSEVVSTGDHGLIGAAGMEPDGVAGTGAVVDVVQIRGRLVPVGVVSPDDASVHGFGSSVAVDGDRALVGAPGTEVEGKEDAGAVFEYRRTDGEWVREGRVSLDIHEEGARFGSGVALDGDVALIGAEGVEVSGQAGAGEVHAFSYGSGEWRREERITLASPSPDDRFGSAVALEGDRALIGVEGKSAVASDQGIVYEYRHDGDSWGDIEEIIQLGGHIADSGDRFGASVVLDGDHAVVGAPGTEVDGKEDAGAAYTFEYDSDEETWELDTTHDRSDSAGVDDRLGSAVGARDLLDDDIYVGAEGDRVDLGPGPVAAGGVHAFSFGFLTSTLHSGGDLEAEARFGGAVALGDDRLLVAGAGKEIMYDHRLDGEEGWQVQSIDRFNDPAGSIDMVGDVIRFGRPAFEHAGEADAGRAGFRRGGGTRSIYLDPPEAGQRFGHSVALTSEATIVGAPGRTVDGEAGAGSAYVYDGDTRQADLVAPDPQEDARFGWSVALDDGRALVGAPGADVDGAADAGAAYVFVDDGTGSWSLQASIPNPDPGDDELFGTSVALDDGRALVGAPGAELDGEPGAGAAYTFTLDAGAWPLEDRLTMPAPSAGERFGRTVALDGDRSLIGAVGAAYAFAADDDGDWVETERISDADATDAFGAHIDLRGARAAVTDHLRDVHGLEEVGTVHVLSPSFLHAAFAFEPSSGIAQGDEVRLEAETLSPGSQSVETRWRLGDGATETGPTVSHSFPAGTHEVCLTVRADGHEDETCEEITVEAVSIVEVLLPAPGVAWIVAAVGLAALATTLRRRR